MKSLYSPYSALTTRDGWRRMTAMSIPFPPSGSIPGTNPSLTSPVKLQAPMAPTAVETPESNVSLSFNVPFSSNLAGPDVEDILHASPGAVERWLHPEGTPDGPPTHKLPVHSGNVEALRKLCKEIAESNKERNLDATVTVSEPKQIATLRRPKGLVTNVCLSGRVDVVGQMRGRILREMPVAMKCATVDIDCNLVIDAATDAVRANVLEHLDLVAKYTGTDIFLLAPKQTDPETNASFNGGPDAGLDQRLRVAIYGDMESSEHAKTRVLIMIDQILKRTVDAMKLELSMHTLICGRSRKNIKLIESATNTAIYFPPPFPQVYGYTPPGATRRSEDEVFITGEKPENIVLAKQKLHELVMGTKCFVKDAMVSPNKIDSILLERLEKVKKIMETNGSYVQFPPLGSQRGVVRVQGTEVLHVERTVREIMALAGQFYSATWWILLPDPNASNSFRAPSSSDIRAMLSDVCMNSGADVSFDKLTFSINGSDDSVKTALFVIHQIPFVNKAQYQMRIKIELANEHKEFVSGKKNGKINKIMSQSNVQIIFDGFNEYNFYIDVCGSQYKATTVGLDLVEQEMPASISFHVPDQYHKRIIGIGGQHIQRIMKKYSVFVKFSNAMDRGGIGREDDDIKVDNVICRTPARNAASLDLVKQEIMDMVEQVDADHVQETVHINRLYHRELITRMNELEELEKKWNCKIIFPSTEMASDSITIAGPEYQVPQAVDEFLVRQYLASLPHMEGLANIYVSQGMVPESHEIVLPSSAELKEYLQSQEFQGEVHGPLKARYEVDLHINKDDQADTDSSIERLLLTYTRNNAGGLRDAIDFLISRLVAHGLDATTIKGAIPRPKSDSFEESLPFFDSKLLQHAPPPLVTESPTKANLGPEENSGVSIFEKLRKPGSMSSISSFLDRRKHHTSSPGSFFRNGSSNGSKASLVSIESQNSAYRNPWNDSGVNLAEDDQHHWPTKAEGSKFPFSSNGGDITPRHDLRTSVDSGTAARPSTSSSSTGYPAPIGPPR